MVIFLNLLYKVLEIYYFILVAYVLLGWIPDIRRSKFYEILHKLADPYIRIFRGLIVVGYVDFTPIIGFLIYGFGLQALAVFIANA